ncbi:centromere protein X isoform X2 [Brienomyrus brachyistius]|uniref:centromere protein X isoform X2 n=1 Tax=Brienomyrus brachyistius TaxID=42636 RepID=UPI0020B38ED5|nr:centromere protein X isoform X2 [Brienomyrus brachyistius]
METVGKLLSFFFKDEKTKISGDAGILMTELLKIFVEEAARRSVKQADAEDCDLVDIEHFEKILPQLVSLQGPFVSWTSSNLCFHILCVSYDCWGREIPSP